MCRELQCHDVKTCVTRVSVKNNLFFSRDRDAPSSWHGMSVKNFLVSVFTKNNIYFLVAWLKFNNLSISLKQHVKTKWNSMYFMMKSILRMKSEIKIILMERDEITKISDIDFNLLTNLVKFLQPFTECSEFLSREVVPTICQYVLWYKKLLRLCSKNSMDSDKIDNKKNETTTNPLQCFIFKSSF